MKKIYKENKKIIIIIFILFIIMIITYLVSKLTINENNNKIFKNQEYIIEKEITKNDTKTFRLPFINLNNDKIREINNSIMEKYYTAKVNPDSTFDYSYTENNGILSLLISYSICDDGDYCNVQYDSYNIDINNIKILNNENILNKYNYDFNIIENTINQKMNEYYIYENENNYIDKNMSLEEYMNERQINDYNDIDIFIDKNNKLKIYKNYTLSYRMSIDDNFTENPYEFEIK